MLRWSITVGEKPRGMCRPKIALHKWDDEPDNQLNIMTRYDCAKVYAGGCSKLTRGSCTLCPLGNAQNVVPDGFIRTDLKFYSSASHQDRELIKGCNCNTTSKIYEMVPFIDFRDFTFEFYPEWRPGYPDYSDYVEFLRDTYCMPAAEEYGRRLSMALASVHTATQVFASDAGHPAKAEGGSAKTSPTRRLKVAG